MVTLAVFLVGALVYEKDQMKSIVGIIMISIAISFFRIWMILKLVVFIRRNRTSLIAQQILITSWIEVSFALAIPAACAVFAYFDGLRFGTTHLVILGVCFSRLKP